MLLQPTRDREATNQPISKPANQRVPLPLVARE